MARIRRLSQIPDSVAFSGDDVLISIPGLARIGEGCAFHEHTRLQSEGGLTIGSYVHAGAGLTIFTTNHDFRDGEAIPYSPGDLAKPVAIEDFVWIGANVSIVPGVTVGEGAVIGMGAVVTKDVPKGEIVGGNPARTLGSRDMEMFEQLKNERKFH
jgi:maltose O-acetyltransferase